MKYLASLLVVLLPSLVFSQVANFKVQGKLNDKVAGGKIYFNYRSTEGEVLDSLFTNHGEFEFSGTINGPQQATLLLDTNNTGFQEFVSTSDKIMFFLDIDEEIRIESYETFKQAQITNSKINELHRAYKSLIAESIEKMRQINIRYMQADPELQNNEDYIRKTEKEFAVVENELFRIQRKYITENPNSFFSLLALFEFLNVTEDMSELETMFSGLSVALQNSERGKAFKNQLKTRRLASIGDVAPEVVLPDMEGKTVSLSSFKGKYVFLDFWASWCGPCRQENPFLVSTYRKYRSQHFEIVGVSLDKNRQDWLKAVKDDQLSWVQLSDLKAWGTAAATDYGIIGVPQNYLISPEGVIIAKNLRGEELEKMLAELALPLNTQS